MGIFELCLYFSGYNIKKAQIELEKISKFSKEQFIKWQEEKKWQIVKFHFENNPFYRKKIGKFLPQRWEDLPIMNKSDYQKNLVSIISKKFNLRNIYVSSTSGSSGNPFTFAKDKYAHAMTWAFIKRIYSNLNVPIGSKEARFYGIPKEKKQYIIEKIKDYIMNRTRFPVFDLSDEILYSFVEKFKNIKFDYIYGYTNSIVHFSLFLSRNKIILKEICPSLKLVIVTSEICTNEDREIISNAIGLPVKNEYGASEFGYIAYECYYGNWHLAEENIYIESSKSSDKKDHSYGSIIITDLHNKALPFIRYSIGDIGIVSDEFCPCGAKSRILKELIGRTNDMIRLPSGKISPGLTFYYISRSILKESDFIKEFIIRQINLNEFVFDVVSDVPLRNNEIDKIKNKMDVYLEPGLKLIINQVEKIKRPDSKKIKHFYSEI